MENSLFAVSADSTGQQDFITDDNRQSSVNKSLSISSSEDECSSSIDGIGASCGRRNGVLMVENYIESGSRSPGTGDAGKCFSESKYLVPCQADAHHTKVETCWQKTRHIGSTSKELQCPEPTSAKNGATLDAIFVADDSMREESSQICADGFCSNSMQQQELGYAAGASSVQNHTGETLGIPDTDMSSILAISDLSLTPELLGDESLQQAAPPISSGFLLPPTRQNDRSNGMLHVDMVSISSDILPTSPVEISSHEARRNSRRLFWDAFSRRSSRRNRTSPTIATEDTYDVGSHGRWLLDFSGDLFDSGIRDLGYRNSRINSPYERLWRSRSELWERLRGSLEERRRRTTFCASGLHPNGTCSCETFSRSEESGIHASISRIVMLAEALFEVLDEIHRQPIFLSMMSLPAPESLVDSFPLKCHERPNLLLIEDDVEKCYICLGEYEQGDKIRVLPCHHEYHMLCVDKWLKEIHGVCPLCRGDVCEGVAVGSVSSS
ncbi:hypothetical protein AAC387_Pa05g2533 [Persea americana]